ncbi:MAG: GAF domain-containing protein [Chloroflexi bacterium]|nr:GAF domain-containing protein [Chloroflexota bacterium]
MALKDTQAHPAGGAAPIPHDSEATPRQKDRGRHVQKYVALGPEPSGLAGQFSAIEKGARRPSAWLEQWLSRLLELRLAEIGAEAARLWLTNSAGKLSLVVALDDTQPAFECRAKGEGAFACTCAAAALDGAAIFLDPKSYPGLHTLCSSANSRAIAVLPIKGSGKTMGVLCLARKKGGRFSPEERPRLAELCESITRAVETGELPDEVVQTEVRQKAVQAKWELLSRVSHELRTPLGFIKGFTSTLLRDDITMTPETRKEFLQIIETEAHKLERLIDDLLDESRFQAGRISIEPRPMSALRFMAEVLTKAQRTAEAGGHTLKVKLPGEDVVIKADPTRLEQVVHNLLNNAVRYAQPGTPIEITMTRGEAKALINVSNYGESIPEAEQVQIFDPFFRGKVARQKGIRGLGLGLAICRDIVHAHGGEIWVENKPRYGCTFSFTVPLAEGTYEAKAS